MFIGTHSDEMAYKLEVNGYPLIKKYTVDDKTIYIFKDIRKLTFNIDNGRDIFYTNKMTF